MNNCSFLFKVKRWSGLLFSASIILLAKPVAAAPFCRYVAENFSDLIAEDPDVAVADALGQDETLTETSEAPANWDDLLAYCEDMGWDGYGNLPPPVPGPCANSPSTAPNSVPYCVCPLRSYSTSDATYNSQQLASCITVTTVGGTVALPNYTAAYLTPLVLSKRVNLTTDGRYSNCSPIDPCAALIASSTATYLLYVPPGAAGSQIRFLRFHGNKGPRPWTLGNVLQLVILGADGITFTGNAVYNNIGGQAVLVGGPGGYVVHHATVTFNDIRDNGGRNPGEFGSDGLAVWDGQGHNVSGNFIRNNTDVDLIFGGCQGCTINSNTVVHSGWAQARANSALMLQQWRPNGVFNFWTSGRYDSSRILSNTINCQVEGGGQGCGVGLELGAARWPTSIPATDWMAYGEVAGNSVANAAIGILVNHSIRSSVHDNGVYSSGGTTYGGGLCGGQTLPACAYSGLSQANGVYIAGGNCAWQRRDNLGHNCFIAGSP